MQVEIKRSEPNNIYFIASYKSKDDRTQYRTSPEPVKCVTRSALSHTTESFVPTQAELHYDSIQALVQTTSCSVTILGKFIGILFLGDNNNEVGSLTAEPDNLNIAESADARGRAANTMRSWCRIRNGRWGLGIKESGFSALSECCSLRKVVDRLV